MFKIVVRSHDVFAKNKTILADFKDGVDESLFKKIETYGPKKGEKYRDDVAFYQSSLDPMRGCTNQRYFVEAYLPLDP